MNTTLQKQVKKCFTKTENQEIPDQSGIKIIKEMI